MKWIGTTDIRCDTRSTASHDRAVREQSESHSALRNGAERRRSAGVFRNIIWSPSALNVCGSHSGSSTIRAPVSRAEPSGSNRLALAPVTSKGRSSRTLFAWDGFGGISGHRHAMLGSERASCRWRAERRYNNGEKHRALHVASRRQTCDEEQTPCPALRDTRVRQVKSNFRRTAGSGTNA